MAGAAAGGGPSADDGGEFYLRYYVGHKGKFGHEFLEFEFRPDGKLRYANNSNYKNDTMIRKEVFVTPAVLRECRRIIAESEVCFPSITLVLFFVLFLSFFAKQNGIGLGLFTIVDLRIHCNNRSENRRVLLLYLMDSLASSVRTVLAIHC